jgi:glutaryl-CoA dehydrogenase
MLVFYGENVPRATGLRDPCHLLWDNLADALRDKRKGEAMARTRTDLGTGEDGRGAPQRPEARDFLGIEAHLSEEEIRVRDEVRSFVETRIEPNIRDWWERGVFPRELVPEMGNLGLLGMHLSGYGCAGKSAVAYGLACMELEAGDSGLRTFVSVQGSLAMSAIHKFGSEEQKSKWLPPMARGEAIGAFGLTEPTAGSDPSSMKTFAHRDGSDWVLNGEKRWIGMGTIADVAIVWAKTDDGIRGFLVPTDAPGFSAKDITSKLSMRASVQCDLFLQDVRLPETAVLPGAEGLKGPFSSLNEARYGIIWGSMGAARSCFECALDYAKEREQFGKPIAAFQLTQEKLVNMMLEIEKGTLVALHLGRMKDEGTLRPEQISFGKLNNVREAIEIAREARTILGGNGITLDYPVMRHMNNLESVRTYEGTDEVHTLILGNALTGVPAFR